jgi:hypothetical protein
MGRERGGNVHRRLQRFSSRGDDDFPDGQLSVMQYDAGSHLLRPVDKQAAADVDILATSPTS